MLDVCERVVICSVLYGWACCWCSPSARCITTHTYLPEMRPGNSGITGWKLGSDCDDMYWPSEKKKEAKMTKKKGKVKSYIYIYLLKYFVRAVDFYRAIDSIYTSNACVACNIVFSCWLFKSSKILKRSVTQWKWAEGICSSSERNYFWISVTVRVKVCFYTYTHSTVCALYHLIDRRGEAFYARWGISSSKSK